MNEYEIIDVLKTIDENGLFVEPKQFAKNSLEADIAKQNMAVVAYKAYKEQITIYRKKNDKVEVINPEFDYPNILELIKTLDDNDRSLSR